MNMSCPERLESLQSFQHRLAERLQLAQKSSAGTKSFLACATGQQRWLFDLAHIEEILSTEPPTPIPFTLHWFLGLVNVRGQLVSVIDLEGFSGADTASSQPSDRVLILSNALPARCAIRITQMMGVIDQARLHPVAPEPTSPQWATHSFTHADGSRYRSVDLLILTAMPSFLEIAQQIA